MCSSVEFTHALHLQIDEGVLLDHILDLILNQDDEGSLVVEGHVEYWEQTGEDVSVIQTFKKDLFTQFVYNVASEF